MNFTQPIVPLLVLMIPSFGQMREHTDPQLSCQANWKSGKLSDFAKYANENCQLPSGWNCSLRRTAA